MSEERGRLRIFFMMAAAAALFLVLAWRLVYWQVLQHHRMALLATRQHQVTVPLIAHRGRILDRNNQILATDTPVYNIVADPELIPAHDKDAIAVALGPRLQLDATQLAGMLRRPLKFEYLKHKVTPDVADRIDALHLPGIAREADVRRAYLAGPAPPVDPKAPHPDPKAAPGAHTSLASNLLGFVNDDSRGQYGIEQYYDRLLGGRNGYESTLKDGANQTIVLSDRTRVDPINGSDVVLSLDSQIQYVAEQALARAVVQHHAESGSVIVMEPRTGNIVAWADYPTYDANSFGASDGSHFADPIVSSLYEPGSVMKVVTLTGALDDGAITPDYTFNETGVVRVGGYTIHDWDLKAHGRITMTRVLDLSLNVGAVKAEQLEGPQNFYQYLERFGIGSRSGVDVAGEVSRPLPPLAGMHPSEIATSSFGQGVAVTPIEMLSAVNTIASGGRYVRPRAVVATIGADGRRIELPPPLGAQSVSPQAAQQMAQMMVDVVDHGSGWTARIDGWKGNQAGKTGTANIPDKGGYSDKVVASYVGFMPANNPRFTMMVVMRKPEGGGLQVEGTFVSAPAWKEIAQQILVQWQITP